MRVAVSSSSVARVGMRVGVRVGSHCRGSIDDMSIQVGDVDSDGQNVNEGRENTMVDVEMKSRSLD